MRKCTSLCESVCICMSVSFYPMSSLCEMSLCSVQCLHEAIELGREELIAPLISNGASAAVSGSISTIDDAKSIHCTMEISALEL